MKRVISAVLGLSVAATMAVGLTGCGGGSGSDTLTWVCIGEKPADQDTVMSKLNEMLEPELGMKLDIQYIDAASFTEKTKMKMASSEPVDLYFTGYVNDYQTAVSMGGLYDITEKMENIKMSDGSTVKMSDVIEDYYIQSAMVNGKIYGIPCIQVISNPQCIVMKKSVADECGVDLEGLENLAVNNTNMETGKALMTKLTGELGKIKEKRPDLYTINSFNPMTTNINEEIIGGVGIKKDGSSDDIFILDFEDEAKYSYGVIREWYEKGYIRSDAASAPSMSGVESENAHGMVVGTWKPGQDIYYKNQHDGEAPAYALLAEPYVGRKSALATMVSVGANTKHPDEAIKLIYLLNSDKELYNTLCWGIEGKHYTKNADGTAKEIEGSGYEKIAQNAWKYGNQFNAFVMEGQPADVWEQTAKMNDDAKKSPVLGFVPNVDELNSEIANIANVQAEFAAKKGSGTSPVDEWYDDYVAKLKTAGIEKVRDELQKQYNEWKASK